MGRVLPFRWRRRRGSSERRPRPARHQIARMIALASMAGAVAGYLLFDLMGATSSDSAPRAQAATPSTDSIIGQASVIDGDTLEIHGTRIRLHGVDAPESNQLCMIQSSKSRCGQRASLALSDKIGGGVVSCTPRDMDRYGRVVAVCHAHGEDLNGWMVASGWAMAYRDYSADYVQQEQRATAAKVGIWQGEFVPPWDWRRGTRLAAEQVEARPSGACDIKGNISSSGERIYHVPGGEYYPPTKISPSKGERWFCSESEAQAAGWRRSRR